MIVALTMLAASPAVPVRTPVRTIVVNPQKAVDRVETTRVDFAPGESMPMHKHTVPVVCFVTLGTLMVKIADGAERPAHVGDATYEPADTIVNYFQNASSKAPAQLMCALLAGKDDTRLSVMLAPPR